MELSEILIRLRGEKGLSQAELAQELGITRQTISRWEAGKARPSAENLVALGRVYGMTAEELMAGEKREETAMEAVPPVTEEKISEPGTPEEPEQAKPRRKMTLWALLLVVCLCVGVYIWGVLTHSRVEASMLIQFVVIFAVLEWLVHAILRAIASYQDQEESPAVETGANSPQTKGKTPRKKVALAALIIFGYALIYFMGVLTDSQGMAKNTLEALTFLIILVWILYSLYVIVEHVKKIDKKEELSEPEQVKPRRSTTFWILLLMAFVCVGVYIWGELTHSRAGASMFVEFVVIFAVLAWLVHAILRAIASYYKKRKKG